MSSTPYDIFDITSTIPYELVDIQAMTNNTIIGQYVSDPTMIRDKHNKAYVFYHRKYLLDIISGCEISNNGWDVTVSSGEVVINNNTLSVAEFNITIMPSTYGLLYINDSGVVEYYESTNAIGGYDISIADNNCILGFIYTGSNEITTIERLEPYSNYICCQIQQLKAGVDPNKDPFDYDDYEWDGIEYRLNVGDKCSVDYVSGDDAMYINYIRDMATYIRKIDLLTIESFQYIFNVYKNTDVIYIDNDVSDGYISSYSLFSDYKVYSDGKVTIFNSVSPYTRNRQIEYISSAGYTTFSAAPEVTTPFIYGDEQYMSKIENEVLCDIYDVSGTLIKTIDTIPDKTNNSIEGFTDISDIIDGIYELKYSDILLSISNEPFIVDNDDTINVYRVPYFNDNNELQVLDLTYPSKYTIEYYTEVNVNKTYEDIQSYLNENTTDNKITNDYLIDNNKDILVSKISEEIQSYVNENTIDNKITNDYLIQVYTTTYIKEII